jgi:hypothetical protein
MGCRNRVPKSSKWWINLARRFGRLKWDPGHRRRVQRHASSHHGRLCRTGQFLNQFDFFVQTKIEDFEIGPYGDRMVMLMKILIPTARTSPNTIWLTVQP